nr:hypothetical protein [Tanacetum cinerariifolium]
MPKYTIKSTNKVTLKEHDQKSAHYQTMHENKSFHINPVNHGLYHALMEALIEDENVMDKGVVDTVKDCNTPKICLCSEMLTMGCYVIVQQTRYRKRP